VNEIINNPRIKQQTTDVLSGKDRIRRINIKETMNLEIKFVMVTAYIYLSLMRKAILL
jgi:hypothetical protein